MRVRVEPAGCECEREIECHAGSSALMQCSHLVGLGDGRAGEGRGEPRRQRQAGRAGREADDGRSGGVWRVQVQARGLRGDGRGGAGRAQVDFVADEHHGHLVRVLHAADLLAVRGDVVEALQVVQREHQQEALASTHVLVPHRAAQCNNYFLLGL